MVFFAGSSYIRFLMDSLIFRYPLTWNDLLIPLSCRNVRETTPCSLIRESEAAGTPGSTTRRRAAAGPRTEATALRSVPTSQEMEEFFAGAELVQQRIFTDK